jgi:GNAT superfamily N-acetyltransferase
MGDIANRTAADSSAHAFADGMEMLSSLLPGSYHARAPHGTLLSLTFAMVPVLNAVLSPSIPPDSSEIDLLADQAARKLNGRPWSIRLRGEPTQRILATASKHHLTTVEHARLMVTELSERPLEPATNNGIRVRRLSSGEYQTFADVVGAGFGAPAHFVSEVYPASVLGDPRLAPYVAETEGGVAAAAGIGFRNDGHLGLGNIATVPEFRHRGYATALVETLMSHGHLAGAHTAYLHSHDDTLSFFTRFGFADVETWTTLSGP